MRACARAGTPAHTRAETEQRVRLGGTRQLCRVAPAHKFNSVSAQMLKNPQYSQRLSHYQVDLFFKCGRLRRWIAATLYAFCAGKVLLCGGAMCAFRWRAAGMNYGATGEIHTGAPGDHLITSECEGTKRKKKKSLASRWCVVMKCASKCTFRVLRWKQRARSQRDPVVFRVWSHYVHAVQLQAWEQ